MHRTLPLIIAGLLFISGCSGMYYSALEQVGIPKRDLMVKRVEAAQESQAEASEQFKSALDQFRSVVNVRGGRLEEEYTRLKSELDSSEAKAREVSDRIDSIEDVSEALFAEWEDELDRYASDKLRRMSEEQLRRTRLRYNTMMQAMRLAEDKMEPVLQPLRDNVLLLKHSLNAQAIGQLAGELGSITENVDVLMRDLEVSISEADRFIGEIQREP